MGQFSVFLTGFRVESGRMNYELKKRREIIKKKEASMLGRAVPISAGFRVEPILKKIFCGWIWGYIKKENLSELVSELGQMGYNRQLLWKDTHVGYQIRRKARSRIKEMTQIIYVIFLFCYRWPAE